MDTVRMTKKERFRFGKDILYDIAGAAIQAAATWCFIQPCQIAPGGVSGISLMVNFLTGLPVGTLSLFLNIPLLVCSYLLLDKRMTLRTLRTVVIITLILDGWMTPFAPQYHGDRLLMSAFGGVLYGVGMTLIFMRGSTTGGSDILAKLLQKKFPYMQTGYAIMVIDVAVISSSILVFGDLEAALYGMISMVCATQTIDAVLYGTNKGTMVMVISRENAAIAKDIMHRLKRGTTFFKTVGGFSGKESETLICAIDRKQFYLIKEIIDEHDPRAFVIVSQTKEVYGEGFINEGRE